MRVLLVNKFYFPQGGADKHVLQLEQRLKDRGHEVAVFAMDHPQNLPTPWSKYFVSFVDFSRVRMNWQGLRAVGRTLHSFEAARKMRNLLRDFRPDVVHVHNIYHQISPSILSVIAEQDIPIVMTLHDYALISSNYNLFAHGSICEHGRHGRYWEYVVHRCIKHSYPASLLAALDQWWHALRKEYGKYVSTFISPSQFLRDVVLDWYQKPLNVLVMPNFVDTKPELVWPKSDYVLFVGRLSPEKGVRTLIRAAKDFAVPTKIVGTGPEEAELKKLSREEDGSRIEWLGAKHGPELQALYANASAVIVPSEWYENCPLVVGEAFALGTPVIASRMGGLPDLVREGVNGYLFTPGSEKSLGHAVNEVFRHPSQRRAMSENALAAAKTLAVESYMTRLESIYASARVR